jgi:hypothetical protein
MGVRIPVITPPDHIVHHRGMGTYATEVKIIVPVITAFIPTTIMTIIKRVPITVVSAVVFRVPGMPGLPIVRIIIPAK